MATFETSIPVIPELPGSVRSIMEEDPTLDTQAALEKQSEGLQHYREGVAFLLDVSLDELHAMGPATITTEITKLTGETPTV